MKPRQHVSTPTSHTRLMVVLGGVSLAIYAILLKLSESFSHEVAQIDRPLLLTLSLFAIVFGLYLAAIRIAIQVEGSVTRWIVGFAVAFRITLLFSEPIQEVDIYRYLWDGIVSTQGVSPFAYAPQTVTESLPSPGLPEDLSRLTRLRAHSPGIKTTLERVHFAHLPSVYPPVSQVVFALSAGVTPERASVGTRVIVMKSVLLLFDLATIYVIVLTLRYVNLHPGWALAYAWCPLVIKEFANSGHLDTIAIFFSTVAVYCALVGLFPNSSNTNATRWLSGGAVLLGLGVGAKLYPVALVPMLAWSSVSRIGWAKTGAIAVAFSLTSLICLAPMLRPSPEIRRAERPSAHVIDEQNPFLVRPEPLEPIDRQAGLKAFLSNWMMNDLIFLSISENITPDSVRDGGPTPWFVVMSNGTRENLARWCSDTCGLEVQRVPFVVARTVTAFLFIGLAGYFAVGAARATTAEQWLEYVFLTMAWFWLLLPTLNPWYWIWGLPWVAFARNRIWLVLSGFLFIYYSRFYFESQAGLHFGPYTGASIFDYVIVWFEYVPWFAALIGWKIWAPQNRAIRESL